MSGARGSSQRFITIGAPSIVKLNIRIFVLSGIEEADYVHMLTSVEICADAGGQAPNTSQRLRLTPMLVTPCERIAWNGTLLSRIYTNRILLSVMTSIYLQAAFLVRPLA